jgi:hypothetical protein
MSSENPFLLDYEQKFNGSSPKGYMRILEFFRTNVIELRFDRRIYPSKKGHAVGHRQPTRRMLCSSNWRFIASPIVNKVFDWKRPKNPARGYQWYKKRNLIITWDILNQEWRMVNLDDWNVIASMPLSTLMEKASFLALYYSTIRRDTKRKDPIGFRRNSFADM